MEPGIARGLNDKFYEKRKAAALDLEKLVRECHSQNDTTRIVQIIDQLVELFAGTSNALHSRNGGLIGLAAAAIALGVEISPFMEKFIEPLLRCFSDAESRIRYFACESMYNIAKVSKGEILVYFNPIFDSLSKLAADSELSVKNGAELLDRLLKDIVAESAPMYFPQYPETERVRNQTQDRGIFGLGIMVSNEQSAEEKEQNVPQKAFSLAHFMPLLSERIYVISPFTRSYLVSWITVLDSVPDLELVSFLPEFLDGLLKYLSDPTEDVRVATENLMADFLREIRDIAMADRQRADKVAQQRARDARPAPIEAKGDEKLPDITVVLPERGAFIPDHDGRSSVNDGESTHHSQTAYDDRDTGAWTRGQGVTVDHAAIVEILIQQLDASHDEIQQSAALRWIAEFLDFAQDVMVPFTPRLIPAILPNLAHHVASIQSAATQTNHNLFAVIQNLPSPAPTPTTTNGPLPPSSNHSASMTSVRTLPASPPATASPIAMRGGLAKEVTPSSDTASLPDGERTTGQHARRKSRDSSVSGDVPPSEASAQQPTASRPQSPQGSTTNGVSALTSLWSTQSPAPIHIPILPSPQPPTQPPLPAQLTGQSQPDQYTSVPEEIEPFDYQATVNMLTVQFISEHEDTRVAALKWLLMLHQKAPKKILAIDDGTFPALLKTLSDPSEEVIKHDLQLLAQISFSSEEGYFKAFMMNLLELFSTDRRLLETRGSLIIRQLCLSLNTDRIYRTFAEILEKEEDLDFAGTMVQRLNLILITSPELVEFRKRLKNLESRDGQILFSALYRSWCHNPVAVFSLCLLAQAYEHASNLLPIVAELEITLQLLVQIDKLVQLIESPVFTYLRLQLLEPDKYPFLFKCLYGLLMLLPQSSAFVSLRNRLNAVSSLGFLHITPRAAPVPTSTIRSKLTRDDSIKWQDLLAHFRAVQTKHEKARRGELSFSSVSPSFTGSNTLAPISSQPTGGSMNSTTTGGTITGRPSPMRRKVTDGSVTTRLSAAAGASAAASVLSPLNPKARTSSGATTTTAGGTIGPSAGRANSPTFGPNKQRRGLGVNPLRR